MFESTFNVLGIPEKVIEPKPTVHSLPSFSLSIGAHAIHVQSCWLPMSCRPTPQSLTETHREHEDTGDSPTYCYRCLSDQLILDLTFYKEGFAPDLYYKASITVYNREPIQTHTTTTHTMHPRQEHTPRARYKEAGHRHTTPTNYKAH